MKHDPYLSDSPSQLWQRILFHFIFWGMVTAPWWTKYLPSDGPPPFDAGDYGFITPTEDNDD